jgi:NAD(P)-dependent dehydrogenase (short-subunit alcohol dehydrogenase family)
MGAQGAVIVSGGTYGIGRAITLTLAAAGWPVVAFGLESLQPGSRAEHGIRDTGAALDEAGLRAELLEADVSSSADVERVVRHALDVHGGIGALVNNAAIRPTGSVLETDEATFERALAVNLKGPFLASRAVLPHLRAGGGGVIVNIGSSAASGRAGLAAYAASKAGLHALTHSLALDHAADAVRVHLVIPRPGTSSGMLEAMQTSPRAAPDEVALAVASLLAPDADAPLVIDLRR